MEIRDINGKQICSGLHVKYIRTHTTGNVNDILVKDDTVWIKIDSSGLYYRADYIEVIENNDAYIKLNKKKKRVNCPIIGATSPTKKTARFCCVGCHGNGIA